MANVPHTPGAYYWFDLNEYQMEGNSMCRVIDFGSLQCECDNQINYTTYSTDDDCSPRIDVIETGWNWNYSCNSSSSKGYQTSFLSSEVISNEGE